MTGIASSVCVALWALVIGATAYLTLALAGVLAFRPRALGSGPHHGDVTALRPLCGDEVGLAEVLESLLSRILWTPHIRGRGLQLAMSGDPRKHARISARAKRAERSCLARGGAAPRHDLASFSEAFEHGEDTPFDRRL